MSSFWATNSTVDGEVQYYSDLPLASDHAGEVWIAKEPSGLWLINRKPAGLYFSNGVDWFYMGDFPDSFNDQNFRIYNGANNTKQLQFDVSSVNALTTRTITMPDNDVDLGLVPSPTAGDINKVLTATGIDTASWQSLPAVSVSTDYSLSGDGSVPNPLQVSQAFKSEVIAYSIALG